MGEVWQARDTKLDRDVALKVLPEAFTADPDRLARFEREAKVLASLNHPNIGSIYGLEEAEGVKALVLELVEGPTLADRIKQGPIPLDEALPIAKQIAEALEAAHEQGVIHRDLKPANIKVKDDGTVKVLDFGLAKALGPNPEGDPSQSPTLTAGATRMGVILGTAAYMAPEQAAGKAVDKRSDVWALGVVLYEHADGTAPVRRGECVAHARRRLDEGDRLELAGRGHAGQPAPIAAPLSGARPATPHARHRRCADRTGRTTKPADHAAGRVRDAARTAGLAASGRHRWRRAGGACGGRWREPSVLGHRPTVARAQALPAHASRYRCLPYR